jgi:hypothetical protein
MAVAEAIKMVNQAKEVALEKDTDVKAPEIFKLNTKWIVFAETVDTYLNRLKGQGRVPLNYVIRTLDEPKDDVIFATEQELMIATAPLMGDQYDIDNECVFGIIKQLILEGPAWSYITNAINRAKDGREAWLALRAHYKGESFLNKQKEEAYKTIEGLHYKGERLTFTFEHFSGMLTKSYNDLQRYGEPVLESKKVRDLLMKILDPNFPTAVRERVKSLVYIMESIKANSNVNKKKEEDDATVIQQILKELTLVLSTPELIDTRKTRKAFDTYTDAIQFNADCRNMTHLS